MFAIGLMGVTRRCGRRRMLCARAANVQWQTHMTYAAFSSLRSTPFIWKFSVLSQSDRGLTPTLIRETTRKGQTPQESEPPPQGWDVAVHRVRGDAFGSLFPAKSCCGSERAVGRGRLASFRARDVVVVGASAAFGAKRSQLIAATHSADFVVISGERRRAHWKGITPSTISCGVRFTLTACMRFTCWPAPRSRDGWRGRRSRWRAGSANGGLRASKRREDTGSS